MPEMNRIKMSKPLIAADGSDDTDKCFGALVAFYFMKP